MEILVPEPTLMHVLDGEKPGTVRVLSRGDFGQEMCGKPPTRYASPDGGSEPTALQPMDEPIHRERSISSVCNARYRCGRTIRSAPQSVCPTARRISRALIVTGRF